MSTACRFRAFRTIDATIDGHRKPAWPHRLRARTEIPDADHFTLYVRGDLILPHLRAFLSRVASRQPVQPRG